MNAAHLHLLLNHVPVIGTIFGFLVLVFGMLKRSTEIKQVAFGIFVVSAVVAIPAYFSGEAAEKIVEHLEGVSEPIIEQHEGAALPATITVAILGLLALGGLIHSIRSNSVPNWIPITLVILSVVTGILMARTANLGGQIRHTELRETAGTVEPTGEIKLDAQKATKSETHGEDHEGDD